MSYAVLLFCPLHGQMGQYPNLIKGLSLCWQKNSDDVGKVTDAKLISTVNYLTTFTCSLFFIWTFAENILWSHAAVNNISPRARALNLFIVLMRGSVGVRQ